MADGQLVEIQFTILDGDSLSNIQDLRNFDVVAIAMSVGWDAADMSFLSTYADPSAYGGPLLQDVYAGGSEFSLSVQDGVFVVFGANDAFRGDGFGFTQIRSGVTAAPVPQTADRTIYLLCKPRGG